MALIRDKIYQSNSTQELIRESRKVFKKTGILGEIDCKKGIVIVRIKIMI